MRVCPTTCDRNPLVDFGYELLWSSWYNLMQTFPLSSDYFINMISFFVAILMKFFFCCLFSELLIHFNHNNPCASSRSHWHWTSTGIPRSKALPSQTAEVKQAGREENLHWCEKRITKTKVAVSLCYFPASSPLKSGRRYAIKKKSTIWLWKLLVAVKCHKYFGAEIAIGFCRTNSEHGDTGLELPRVAKDSSCYSYVLFTVPAFK